MKKKCLYLFPLLIALAGCSGSVEQQNALLTKVNALRDRATADLNAQLTACGNSPKKADCIACCDAIDYILGERADLDLLATDLGNEQYNNALEGANNELVNTRRRCKDKCKDDVEA